MARKKHTEKPKAKSASAPTPEPTAATPAGPAKSTAATMEQRVEEVLRIRIDGAALHEVRAYAAQQGWNVGERQLQNYMRKADKLFREQRERRRGLLLSIHHARRESLYARAVNGSDYRVALAILDSMARLDGFFCDEASVREMMKLAKESKEKLEQLEKRLNDGQSRISPAGSPSRG